MERDRNGQGRPRRSPIQTGHVLGGLLVVAVLAGYGVLAETYSDHHFVPIPNHYPLLAKAFLKGQLSLEVEPSKTLLTASSPYDPAILDKLWDASYFRGKYYLYFGPVPALARAAGALTTGRLTAGSWPIAVYLTGVVVWVALIASFFRTCAAPDSPAWIPWAFGAIFSLNPLHFNLLVVGGMYGEALAASSCFSLLALYLFLRGLESERLGWMFLSGLSLALAFGSRVTSLVLALVLFSTLLIRLVRSRNVDRWMWAKLALAFAVPLGIGGLAYAIYNHLRFGSPFDFGHYYAVGFIDLLELKRSGLAFSTRWLPANMAGILLTLPSVSSTVPFFRFHTAAGMLRSESVCSIFLLFPLFLLALPGLVQLRPGAHPCLRSAARIVVVTLLGLGLLTGCYFALRLQYYQEFLPLLAVLGFASVLKIESWCRQRGLPSRAVVGGVFSVLFVLMLPICFVTLANGLEDWGSRSSLTKLRLVVHAVQPNRSGIGAAPSRYGPNDAAEWRVGGEHFYRFSAPILLTSPCNDPTLDLDFEGAPVGSGTMRIKVDGRMVLARKFGPERVRAGVRLERQGIRQGDLVDVRLLFDRTVVPALEDPKSADLRALTVSVHEIGLYGATPDGSRPMFRAVE